MCLIITESSRKNTANLIREHRKLKTHIIAYKVLIYTTNNMEEFYIKSPYFSSSFTIGLNISNRGSFIKKPLKDNRSIYRNLTITEKETNKVNFGFHCFLYEADAIKLQKTIQSYYYRISPTFSQEVKVFKVLIDPKDVIITGSWSQITGQKEDNYVCDSIACSQLTLQQPLKDQYVLNYYRIK
jgi:hypothetical protein